MQGRQTVQCQPRVVGPTCREVLSLGRRHWCLLSLRWPDAGWNRVGLFWKLTDMTSLTQCESNDRNWRNAYNRRIQKKQKIYAQVTIDQEEALSIVVQCCVPNSAVYSGRHWRCTAAEEAELIALHCWSVLLTYLTTLPPPFSNPTRCTQLHYVIVSHKVTNNNLVEVLINEKISWRKQILRQHSPRSNGMSICSAVKIFSAASEAQRLGYGMVWYGMVY